MANTGTERVKRGMAEMQKGGVIMDVVNAEQAKIAEQAGAVAVMALERVPSDIRAAGGVARMASPEITEEVMNAVSIPVMAKARIGHIVEARVLEAMGADYIDESEVLTPADDVYHLKNQIIPFHLCAVAATWVKRHGALVKVHPCSVRRVSLVQEILLKLFVICVRFSRKSGN